MPLWWGMVMLGEAVHVWGAGDIRELSVCSAQFSCEPKVTLKNSLSKKKKFFLKKRANKPQKDTLMNIKAYS